MFTTNLTYDLVPNPSLRGKGSEINRESHGTFMKCEIVPRGKHNGYKNLCCMPWFRRFVAGLSTRSLESIPDRSIVIFVADSVTGAQCFLSTSVFAFHSHSAVASYSSSCTRCCHQDKRLKPGNCFGNRRVLDRKVFSLLWSFCEHNTELLYVNLVFWYVK